MCNNNSFFGIQYPVNTKNDEFFKKNKSYYKYTYYELTHCKHLWCPCNKCKEQHPRPQNFANDEVMHGRVFGEWDCVLNIEDATYVYPPQNYGIWSKIVIPTI